MPCVIPCTLLGVTPLNNGGDIVLLGGTNGTYLYLTRIYLFNTHTNETRQVCQNNQHSIVPGRFPAVLARRNIVLTVHSNSKDVMEYNHATGQVQDVLQLQ